MIARQARVEGRVQGVGYRRATQRRAQQLGLAGWVRNRTDGSVELRVQGESALVEQLLVWLQEGPPAAAVVRVSSEAVAVQPLDGFEVCY